MSHESKDNGQHKTAKKEPLKDDVLSKASGGMDDWAPLSDDNLSQATGGVAPQLASDDEI